MTAAKDHIDIHPRDIIGNAAVRDIAGYYLKQWKPPTRKTLWEWRKKHADFPAPLPCPRAGVELWDAREIRAWCKAHAEYRERIKATHY
jgi:hypothetical protein